MIGGLVPLRTRDAQLEAKDPRAAADPGHGLWVRSARNEIAARDEAGMADDRRTIKQENMDRVAAVVRVDVEPIRTLENAPALLFHENAVP